MHTTNAESFTLDAGSNIASRTGPAASFSYDTSNRLTSDGTNTYTWSNADRLTGRGSDTFTYDPLDRLTSSTVASTGRTYTYNGDGLLQSRADASSGTTFLWDPSSAPSRLLQVNADRLVYGLGPLYVVKADGSTLSFARDGQKSIRAEVNGSGTVTASFRYRAYGAIAQSNGATTPSDLGYAGQLVDPSGLLYMRARWYDPANGRFTTHDPVASDASSPQTLNAYYYAAANPLLLADPTGACPFEVCQLLADVLGLLPSFSVGPSLGETIEGGLGDLASGGETFSVLAMSKTFENGAVRDSDNALLQSGGVFSTVGDDTVSVPPGQAQSVGGYVGAGGGLFFANATTPEQLLGPFETTKIDLGFILGGSFEFSRSGSTVIGSFSIGPGVGAAFTTMTTMTWRR